MEKLVLKEEASFRETKKQSSERLEPILGYCSDIISHLNREDSAKLTDNLLEILDDLRPCLKANKKALPLIIELSGSVDNSMHK